jgi:hypothetical protein
MSQVKLEVYDLSGGMASAMSQQLLGQRIDGIWHTGVLVFNREYYFGGGIQVAQPGQFSREHRMAPVQSLVLGITSKTQSELEVYLWEIGPRFTQSTYDLIRNNCNNFSDVVCRFLLGSGIPSYIVDLPNRVFSTPMGAMLRPMIEGMQNNIMHSHGSGMDPFGHTSAPGRNISSNASISSAPIGVISPLPSPAAAAAVISAPLPVTVSIPHAATLEERALISGDATTIQTMGDKLLNAAIEGGVAGSALLEEEKLMIAEIIKTLKTPSMASQSATVPPFSVASYGLLESVMERFPSLQMSSLFILRLMVLHDQHPATSYARIIRSLVAKLQTAMSTAAALPPSVSSFSGIPAQVMALCALSNLLSHDSGADFLFNNTHQRNAAGCGIFDDDGSAVPVDDESTAGSSEQLISTVVDIAVGYLSHARSEVRQLAAAIVYNVALLGTKQGCLSGSWAHSAVNTAVDPSVLHPQALHILCGCIENILTEQDANVRRRELATICRIVRACGSAASKLLDDLGVLTPGDGLHALHQELLRKQQQQLRDGKGSKSAVVVSAEDELTIITEILKIAQNYK